MLHSVSVVCQDTVTQGDCVVLVTHCLDQVKDEALALGLKALRAQIAVAPDSSKDGCLVPAPGLAGGRVVLAPTGPLDRDYDDARRWTEAACEGIKRAIKAGAKAPVLAVFFPTSWPTAPLLALMGALDGAYVPHEIRQDVPARKAKLTKLAVYRYSADVIKKATALDAAKSVAKDIGGGDPERMAPPAVEAYVKEAFVAGCGVGVEVVSDDTALVKDYPLFSAVNRCAKGVPRHAGRVIYLSYKGEGAVGRSVFLVGKGVTYDTGGADIKAGGVMAGMHRDKCGAAAVAGYFKFLEIMKPKNIQVTGALCMVRNSVGSECYVADEIITSRAGVRVRVGNTDAEGRMAMADVLCRAKEMAEGQPDPHLFTVATLTGHCCLAVGDGYTAAMDNGPARRADVAGQLQRAGDLLAEPVEISTIRREDYAFHRGKSEYEDVLQCNNAPSSRTPRGHQTPAAFMVLAAGLDKHGLDSKAPLKYTHVDIAAASGPFPGVPTGAPILAFAKTFSPELF